MGLEAPEDGAKFEEAWLDFARRCAETVAPEATYQAWLAHFAIQRFGMLRVVREVDFGARYLGPEAVAHFPESNLMVDLLVLRDQDPPSDLAVDLPRRSWLGPKAPTYDSPNARSGLERLQNFSVITELKVASSQGGGLNHGAVLRDFRKLSVILSRAADQYPEHHLPTAFVGVLDNHRTKRFNFDLLRDRIHEAGIRSDVHLLETPSAAE